MTCRDETEGYCGYSQETMNAIVKERDSLKAKNERLKDEMDKWNLTSKDIEKELTFEQENKRLIGRLNDIINCSVLKPQCRACAKKNEFARAALKGE